jgi:hypothetical protein
MQQFQNRRLATRERSYYPEIRCDMQAVGEPTAKHECAHDLENFIRQVHVFAHRRNQFREQFSRLSTRAEAGSEPKILS